MSTFQSRHELDTERTYRVIMSAYTHDTNELLFEKLMFTYKPTTNNLNDTLRDLRDYIDNSFDYIRTSVRQGRYHVIRPTHKYEFYYDLRLIR